MVNYSGSWEKTEVTGFYNLFEYSYLVAKAGQKANCTYQIQIPETGMYDICLMYFPKEKYASNASITINHANGTDVVKWNFRRGDKHGFAVKLGSFYFEKNNPAQVIISNENADGEIVADGVGFIKVK